MANETVEKAKTQEEQRNVETQETPKAKTSTKADTIEVAKAEFDEMKAFMEETRQRLAEQDGIPAVPMSERVAKANRAKAAIKEAKDKKVSFKIYADPSRKHAPQFVCVNGERYMIQPGETVEIPAFVAEVLEHREEQRIAAMHMMDGLEDAYIKKSEGR